VHNPYNHNRMHQHTLRDAGVMRDPRAVERVVHIADAPRIYAFRNTPRMIRGQVLKFLMRRPLVDGSICPRYSGRKSRETYRRPAAFALWK